MLLDEQLPRQLARELIGHDVQPSNTLEDLLPLVPSILVEIPNAQAGRVVGVEA